MGCYVFCSLIPKGFDLSLQLAELAGSNSASQFKGLDYYRLILKLNNATDKTRICWVQSLFLPSYSFSNNLHFQQPESDVVFRENKISPDESKYGQQIEFFTT